MSISAISSSGSYQASPLSAKYNQQLQDFKDLSSSLQSGSLSGAQNAFAAFLQDSQGAPPPQAASQSVQNDPLSVDIKNLLSALQSGDSTNAADALSAFLKDLQSAQGTHHKHHHQCQDCCSDQSQGADPAGTVTSVSSTDTTAGNTSSSVQEVA